MTLDVEGHDDHVPSGTAAVLDIIGKVRFRHKSYVAKRRLGTALIRSHMRRQFFQTQGACQFEYMADESAAEAPVCGRRD